MCYWVMMVDTVGVQIDDVERRVKVMIRVLIEDMVWVLLILLRGRSTLIEGRGFFIVVDRRKLYAGALSF